MAFTLQIQKMLSDNEPARCSFNDCLHLGEPGCVVKGDWDRYSYYFQLLDEIRIREEFQLRTFGTKREGDVRYDKVIHRMCLVKHLSYHSACLTICGAQIASGAFFSCHRDK